MKYCWSYFDINIIQHVYLHHSAALIFSINNHIHTPSFFDHPCLRPDPLLILPSSQVSQALLCSASLLVRPRVLFHVARPHTFFSSPRYVFPVYPEPREAVQTRAVARRKSLEDLLFFFVTWLVQIGGVICTPIFLYAVHLCVRSNYCVPYTAHHHTPFTHFFLQRQVYDVYFYPPLISRLPSTRRAPENPRMGECSARKAAHRQSTQDRMVSDQGAQHSTIPRQ